MRQVITFIARCKNNYRQALIRQALTVFFAGVLLFVSTACSSDRNLQARNPNSVSHGYYQTQPVDRKDYLSRDLYQPKTYERNPKDSQGMNNYSDVDPRANTRDAERKAQQLVKGANRNIIDMSKDVQTNSDRILSKKGENFEQLGKNIQEGTKQTSQNIKENIRDIGEGTKRGLSNIKENIRNAPEDLKEKAFETRQ